MNFFRKLVARNLSRPENTLIGRIVERAMIRSRNYENPWAMKLLEVQPGQRLLEIGFGPGILIQQITSKVDDVFVAGIDYSQAMVEKASRRNRSGMQAGKVDIRYGSVYNLPFPTEDFDTVFAVHVIYFWKDLGSALGQIYDSLKPGGKFIAMFESKDQLEAYKYADTEYFFARENTEYGLALEAAKFRDVQLLEHQAKTGLAVVIGTKKSGQE